MVCRILCPDGNNLSALALMPEDGVNTKNNRMDFISGEIIGIDKPLGWTSFDAVKRLRGAIQRRLHVKKFKVGHAGTLDPSLRACLSFAREGLHARLTTYRTATRNTWPSYGLGRRPRASTLRLKLTGNILGSTSQRKQWKMLCQILWAR